MISQDIKVREYTSASINGKSTRAFPKPIVKSTNVHAALKINFLKLSAAMVKANTTTESSVWSQAYDILLSSLTLYGLLDYKQSEVCLKDGFRDKYRDFSKSGRTGELGQAINYIFAQEKLGFKFVFDYGEFLTANSIPPKTKGGTPDYVLLGKRNSNLAVLESKGSSPKEELTKFQLRAKLQGAMDNQCIPGVSYLRNKGKFRVSNSYASVIELSESSESRESLIHFADPEYDEFELQDYSDAINNYYVRWLLFLYGLPVEGNFDVKEMIDKPNFDVVRYEGNDFFIQKSSFSNGYLRAPARYGISKKIIELLKEGNYEAVYFLDTPAQSLDNVEIFSDGTIAIGKKEI